MAEDVMMSFRDQNLADSFLSEDEIRKRCPLAYVETPTNKNVSEKYVIANTATVISDMEKLGWKVVDAKQRKGKKTASGTTRFSYHMICFQNPDVKIIKTVTNPDGTVNEEVDCYPRIILTNSHDGLNCFHFRVGLFRLVCSNGLVIATDKFADLKIRHINYTMDELRALVNKVIEELPNQVELMTQMKSRVLTEDEKKAFVLDMLKIRKGKDLEDVLEVDDETVLDMLEPVRDEDKSDDLWTVFNVLQEKVIKGGFSIGQEGKKARKARKVTGFVKDLELNQKMFKAAMKFINN